MIDIRKLKELVRLMVENDLSELDLRDQEETVTIKRGGQVGPMASIGQPVYHAAPPGRAMAAGDDTAEAASHGEGTPRASDEGLVAIESPMVGTFYSSPTPDAEPFVSVGASVANGSVVCIVEAMKVFNEIKCEVEGTVERVCVKSGDAVEFGQPLFMVRPA